MLKGPPQPGVGRSAKSIWLPWNAPEVLGDGFIALRMSLSSGFMFYVLSETWGAFITPEKMFIVQEFPHSYNNQVVT